MDVQELWSDGVSYIEYFNTSSILENQVTLPEKNHNKNGNTIDFQYIE